MMSERIKLLEAQCWEPRQYGPAWFDSTKFAESIVRECVAQVRKDENGPAYEAAGRIAEHFGIE